MTQTPKAAVYSYLLLSSLLHFGLHQLVPPIRCFHCLRRVISQNFPLLFFRFSVGFLSGFAAFLRRFWLVFALDRHFRRSIACPIRSNLRAFYALRIAPYLTPIRRSNLDHCGRFRRAGKSDQARPCKRRFASLSDLARRREKLWGRACTNQARAASLSPLTLPIAVRRR